MMVANPLPYSVLAYEDECGLWLKIPELGLQLCADDLESGLEDLSEHLDVELRFRMERGVSRRLYGTRRRSRQASS